MKRFFLLLLFNVLQTSAFEPLSLSEAVRWGTFSQVRAFLWYRASPNAWDEDGRTPMHYAVLREDKEGIPILHALLAAKGNMFIKDKQDQTPVYDALTCGNKESLKVFIMCCGLRIYIDSSLRKKYPVIARAEAELLLARRNLAKSVTVE